MKSVRKRQHDKRIYVYTIYMNVFIHYIYIYVCMCVCICNEAVNVLNEKTVNNIVVLLIQ